MLPKVMKGNLRPTVACTMSIAVLAMAGSAYGSTESDSRTPPLSSVTKTPPEHSSAAAAISSIPPVAISRTWNGSLVSPGDESNPLTYGAAVPVGQLQPPAMIGGGVGFALTGTDRSGGYLYPARTLDGGQTWAIDGAWFANPTADAVNFVNTIGGASSQVAWAWNRRSAAPSQVLFTTMDGGRQWYRTVWMGIVSGASDRDQTESSSTELHR